jgi:hypothetical protein
MSKFSNVLKVMAGLAGVVLIGLLLGWLGSSGRHASAPPPVPVPAAADTEDKTGFSPPPITSSSQPAEPITNENPATVAAPPSGLITNWSDKLDEILTSNAEEADKAKQLLEMFPHLSEEAQVEVAGHLANLLPDKDYLALAKYLADPKMPESVLEVLLGDALNRPNSVKLPLLLEVARQSDHPKAGEAKDILELFLEEDHGKNWDQWQAKLEQWLKDNPD